MALTVAKMARLFSFNGVRLPDPNPKMTVDEVKALYATRYPELATAVGERAGGRGRQDALHVRAGDRKQGLGHAKESLQASVGGHCRPAATGGWTSHSSRHTTDEVHGMSTVAASIRVYGSSPPFGLTPTPHIGPASASGLDPSLLMARGDGLAIPRLAGVPIRHQLWRGERTAARVALAMFEAGVADSSAWPECQGSPFELIRRSIERWVKRHSKSPVVQAVLPGCIGIVPT
jgi:PRTRC genetic system protein C